MAYQAEDIAGATRRMLYPAYQAMTDLAAPWRQFARLSACWLDGPGSAVRDGGGLRRVAAALDLVARAGTTHTSPPFGIASVMMGNREVAVREEIADSTPFASLRHFVKDTPGEQPKLLVVAPMSGHFATLLRGTVRTLLADHDVYVTDWRNARDVPLRHGGFDLDDFIDHIMRFFTAIGPGGHVLAVCQPTVPVLAAVALMAQDNHPAQPRSMTLMAGPIDTRLNPSKVNALAQSQPIEWFERKLISSVPARCPGALRRVYPGFVQLIAFMSMNLDRHRAAFERYYQDMIAGDIERVESHRRFYDEYFAVMDLPAEFYLQTIAKVFQQHELPRGVLKWRGHAVAPRAIRHTALLTVEGELDDICSVGQTMAALDLCVGLRPSMRKHHLQTGVGHYGVFNGRRWIKEIYPRVRATIQARSV
jgi:polyhydroxyalkanoate depolymerase